MQTLDEPKLKSPHGARVSMGHAREWNGITVQAMELICEAGRVWHDISAPPLSINIVLEQMGGRVEPRTRINQPSPSNWSGAQHVDFVPAAMPLWGYSEGVRGIRTAKLLFDVPRVESLLGDEIDLHRLEVPRLRFHDDRIVKLGALLSAECAIPGDDLSSLYGDSLTVAIVVDLLRLTRHRGENCNRGKLAPWQLRRATEYMTAHLSTCVRMRDLAQVTELSQSRFGRAFKASTGVTPHRWLLNARIALAQQLLLDGDIPLGQIAFLTGFSEQSHFTRVFRSIVGTSPGAWQRNRRT